MTVLIFFFGQIICTPNRSLPLEPPLSDSRTSRNTFWLPSFCERDYVQTPVILLLVLLHPRLRVAGLESFLHYVVHCIAYAGRGQDLRCKMSHLAMILREFPQETMMATLLLQRGSEGEERFGCCPRASSSWSSRRGQEDHLEHVGEKPSVQTSHPVCLDAPFQAVHCSLVHWCTCTTLRSIPEWCKCFTTSIFLANTCKHFLTWHTRGL